LLIHIDYITFDLYVILITCVIEQTRRIEKLKIKLKLFQCQEFHAIRNTLFAMFVYSHALIPLTFLRGMHSHWLLNFDMFVNAQKEAMSDIRDVKVICMYRCDQSKKKLVPYSCEPGPLAFITLGICTPKFVTNF
jgi:hypothetical protein